MGAEIDRILIPRERIASRVAEMGRQIASAYDETTARLTIVAILSGVVIFLADLIRHIEHDMKLALIGVSSYPGTATTSRGATIVQDIDANLADEHVLVVDDILDTGNTLRMVQRAVRRQRPASLRTAVLLRKTAKAPPDVEVDFVGFDIEDVFVVGYGLDYDDLYRNYPHIATLRVPAPATTSGS
jgi:hypoxanthine phosphoribosyltransferase